MYLVLKIYLSRMVKTPKVSPLSNRGVRARRVPPVRSTQASHPGGVPEQRATRYVRCWGTLEECDYSLIPIRGYSLRSNHPVTER